MSQDSTEFDIAEYINHPPWPEDAIVPISFYLLVYPSAQKKRFLSECAGRVNKDSEQRICDVRVLRGSQGNVLCRYCGKETATSKQTYCDDTCVQEFTIRTQPKIVRQKLLERDKGMCALCLFPAHFYYQKVSNAGSYESAMHILDSLETEISLLWRKKTKTLRDENNWVSNPKSNRNGKLCKVLKSGMFWEAAHVTDVVDGGGVCGLGGYRTLCVPCHEIETRSCNNRRVNHKFNIDPEDFPPGYYFDTIKRKVFESLGDSKPKVNREHLKNFHEYIKTLQVYQLSPPNRMNISNSTSEFDDILDEKISLDDVSDEDLISSVNNLTKKSPSRNSPFHVKNGDFFKNPESLNSHTEYTTAKSVDSNFHLAKENNTILQNMYTSSSQKCDITLPFNLETGVGSANCGGISLNTVTSKYSKPYTTEDSIVLLKCVSTYGRSWSIIHKLFFIDRSPESLSVKYNKLLNSENLEAFIKSANSLDLPAVRKKILAEQRQISIKPAFALPIKEHPKTSVPEISKFEPSTRAASIKSSTTNYYTANLCNTGYPMQLNPAKQLTHLAKFDNQTPKPDRVQCQNLKSNITTSGSNTHNLSNLSNNHLLPGTDFPYLSNSSKHTHIRSVAISTATSMGSVKSPSNESFYTAFTSLAQHTNRGKDTDTDTDTDKDIDADKNKCAVLVSARCAPSLPKRDQSKSNSKRHRSAWTQEETNAVVEGYKKHGKNWVKIKNEYSNILESRTNISIKDRFRTLIKMGILKQ